MTSVETLLAEFDEEVANTREMLKRVPDDRLAWKPHEKSFPLGKLANHVAALPVGMAFVVTGRGSEPSEAGTTLEVLEAFDKRAAAALKWFMDHLIHHRGQLSIYLRLLDVAVSRMYGSSADEKS
jgi:hypothetical protein